MPRAQRSGTAPSALSHWPYVVLATLVVIGVPLALVTAMQATGALRSALSSVAAAAGLSVLTSALGSALWKRRHRSRDVVFADLMIWGWIRRLRAERRLSSARDLLGGHDDLSAVRRAELLEGLSASLEARDPYTHGHSRRVTRHAEAIARGMGLAQEEVARIRTAAAVHDVGKLLTPREVLNKPGRLDDDEFAAIKRHPAEGAEMVAALGDEALTAMVRHHHERLDGRGYPDGLAGDAIPLGARIIAVADTFDAITSTRPYRPGARHKKALDIIEAEAGAQLDPGAVAAFRRYYTGERSVAWWSIVAGEPARLLSWLLGWLQGAGAAPLAKGVIAAGAAALVGGAITTPAPHAAPRPVRVAAVATVQAEREAGDDRTVLASAPDGKAAESAGRPGGTRRAAAKPRTGRREPRSGGRAHGRVDDAPRKGATGDGGSGAPRTDDPSRGGGDRDGGPPSGGGSGGGDSSGGVTPGSGGGPGGGGTSGGDSTGDSGVTVVVPEVPVASDVVPAGEVKVSDPTGALPPIEVKVPPVTVPGEETPPVQAGPVTVPPIKIP